MAIRRRAEWNEIPGDGGSGGLLKGAVFGPPGVLRDVTDSK